MKKKFFYGLSLLLCLSLSSVNISASESEVIIIQEEKKDEKSTMTESEKFVSQMFDDLEDTEKVLEMPDGGFLSGSGEVGVYYLNDPLKTVVERYNVDTNPNAETVVEATERLMKKAKTTPLDSIQPLADIVVPTKVLPLRYGQEYRSNPFSAKGWRFSGWNFVVDGNDIQYGTALRWSTYIDSGRVGPPEDFIKLEYGGTPIYPGYYYWIDIGLWPTAYWTYNPIKNTYYRVANKDA